MIADKAAAQLGYDTVKPEQREVVNAFVRGNDVFVSLPTGNGKSLCYAMLPLVFDLVHSWPPSTSILICVSPLVALILDQKERFTPKGLNVELKQCRNPAVCMFSLIAVITAPPSTFRSARVGSSPFTRLFPLRPSSHCFPFCVFSFSHHFRFLEESAGTRLCWVYVLQSKHWLVLMPRWCLSTWLVNC